MSELEKRIGNANATLNFRQRVQAMTPGADRDLQDQYGFRENAAAYTQRTLKFGSDVYRARVQGIDENDFYKWHSARIRLSQMVSHGTTQNIIEDWKEIKFESARVNAIGLGAKVECNGNTFIVSNPDEANGTQATAVCRRCNATWRRMDFYGNVIEEPFYWAKNQSQATANEYLDHDVIQNMYQKCVMQLNDETRDLKVNRRMILGSSAYAVRGLVDFLQSETGDRGSTHILYFDLMVQEPIAGDDLVNGIADAEHFRITAKINGSPAETVPGEEYALSVTAVQDGMELSYEDGTTWGTAADGTRIDLGDHPLTWVWNTSDREVAVADASGNLYAVGEGTATIRATLAQNPNVWCETTVTVKDTVEGKLEWLRSADQIEQYLSADFECRWTENGSATDDPVTYTVTSRTGTGNSVAWYVTGHTLTVTGYIPDTLTIKAEANGETSEKTVTVNGF